METVYLVDLKRIEGGQRLRTSEVRGTALYLPEEGKPIQMIADGLSPLSIRSIVTSNVVKIDREGDDIEKLIYLCRTETGSLYRFEVIDFRSVEATEEICINC